MDPRSAGALGGRPNKAATLGKSVAAAVARGSQLTLNFGGTLTLSGPVTIKQRRANLLGAFDTPPTGPPTRPTGRTSPPTRPTTAPREKGARTYVRP